MSDLSGARRAVDHAGRDAAEEQARDARNGTLDMARFLGAVGIVWFHAGAPGREIGYAALPMFTTVLIYLGLRSRRVGTFSEVVVARARRLLGPWAVWSAIYAGAKVTGAVVTGADPAEEIARWSLLVGPSLHLWFLPFAFVASLATWAAWRLLASRSGAFAMTAAGVAATACLSFLAVDCASFGTPFAQWVFVAPNVAIGFSLAVAGDRAATATTLAGLVAVVFAVTTLMGAAPDAGPRQWALGAAAAAILLRTPSTPVTAWLGDAALGIYLTHPLFIAAWRALVGEHDSAGAATVIAGASVLAVALLRRIGLQRTLL